MPRRDEIIEGHVVAVDAEQRIARLKSSSGRAVEARVPQHIGIDWLKAAIAVAPVEAAVVEPPTRRAILWCIFPAAEHASVAVDVDLVGPNVKLHATESVEIRCAKGQVRIDGKGNVSVRGKEVLSRASDANRIKGGVIRFN